MPQHVGATPKCWGDQAAFRSSEQESAHRWRACARPDHQLMQSYKLTEGSEEKGRVANSSLRVLCVMGVTAVSSFSLTSPFPDCSIVLL